MFRVIGFQFNRFRAHLASIEARVEYPILMAPSLPRGLDCRGEREWELYWSYLRDVVKKKDILDASRDMESAGYKQESLELHHD